MHLRHAHHVGDLRLRHAVEETQPNDLLFALGQPNEQRCDDTLVVAAFEAIVVGRQCRLPVDRGRGGGWKMPSGWLCSPSLLPKSPTSRSSRS